MIIMMMTYDDDNDNDSPEAYFEPIEQNWVKAVNYLYKKAPS